METINIGTRSTSDLIEVADISAHSVTVRDMIGGPNGWIGGRKRMLRAARYMAEKALRADHPADVYSIKRTDMHYDGVQWFVTFTAIPRDESAPLDVWLKFADDDDEESEYEANTYPDAVGYRVEWYHTGVGFVRSARFGTLDAAHAWLTKEGFQDFTS